MKFFRYTPPPFLQSAEAKSKHRLLYTCILLGALTAVGCVVNNWLFEFRHDIVFAVITAICLVGLLFLYTANLVRFVAAANLYILFGTSFVVVSALMSGGLSSPSFYWTCLIPLYGFLLLNKRFAQFWLMVAILTPVVFVLLDKSIQNMKVYDFFEGTHIYWALLTLILLTVNIFLIGYDFETKKRHAIAEITSVNEELRKTLQILEQTKKELETAEKHKDLFIAQMSHEMRTPMNTILGTIQLLQSGPATPPEELQVLAQSSSHLLYIIDDLLDLVKLRSGKFHYEKKPFDLPALLRTVDAGNTMKAGEKKLNYGCAIDSSIPHKVCGDAHRLAQILNNVIGNAIKFTRQGSVEWTAAYEIESGTAVFSISDTGIGMTVEEQEKVFEVFSQANAAVHLEYGGTGLGLSITKQLLDLFGGTIVIQSVPQHGTKVHIKLPLQLPADEGENTETRKKLSETQKRVLANATVLLAEDNLTNQQILKKILERELKGICIKTAGSGQEVLDQIYAEEFDLVLMDVQMPGISGIEATRLIRTSKQEQIRKINIIALTAYAANAEAQNCLNAGMNDYIAKPFDTDELLWKMYKHIASLSTVKSHGKEQQTVV